MLSVVFILPVPHPFLQSTKARKPKVKVEDESHQNNAAAIIDGVAKGLSLSGSGTHTPDIKPGSTEDGAPKAKRKKKEKDKDKDKPKDGKDKEDKKKKKKKVRACPLAVCL